MRIDHRGRVCRRQEQTGLLVLMGVQLDCGQHHR